MTKITEMKTSEIVAEYNALTGKSIKKFETRAIAEARLAAARKEDGTAAVAGVIESAVKNGALPPVAPKAQGQKVRTTGLPGPRSQHTGQKLYIKTEGGKNPRKPGTAGHASFALIRDGMTYEQYRLAGGRTNDLAWDIAHGYVVVK